MSILNFKIPKFKMPRFKMSNLPKEFENLINLKSEDIEKNNKPKKNEYYYPNPNFKTIKEAFDKSTTKFKDLPFILQKPNHKEPYKEYTYGQFREDVIGLGTGLIKLLGLENEKIVIISETTYEWYISYMAMLCGVGIAVPLDKELPYNEIENIIKRCDARAIIYSAKKKEAIDKIRDSLDGVKYFIQMNDNSSINDKDVGLDYIMDSGKRLVENGISDFMNIKIDPEEFKVLIFTSGTTSQSKGVMICNRNLAENINAAATYVKIDENDRMFSVLPLHHTYESTIGFLFPMACGSSIAICEGLKYIAPNMQESHPTAILAVPLLVESLHKKITDNIRKSKKESLVNSMIYVTNALKNLNIDIKKKVFKEIYDNLGGSLRIVVSAAAPIDAKVGKWLEDIGILFLQGYGLTETAPIAALTPECNPKIGSAGKAVVCAELKIKNPNENGEGEVLIKSTTTMLGYYKNEEATNKVMEDGWFNSGDIGYLDDEGFLFITGRSKNVIVTQNGKNIYPEEIEIMLNKIPEIKECIVYGKESEDKKKDLTVSALVIPNYEEIEKKYGKIPEKDEIHKIIWEEIKKVNKKLTSYKCIKDLELKEGEFEKTTTMKIKRFVELKKK